VLSDREREILLDIERRVLAEDPDLARSLHGGSTSNNHARLVANVALLAVLLGALVLAAAAMIGAFATAFGLLGWVVAFSITTVSLLLKSAARHPPLR
jgi:hypothetical protein